MHVEPTFNYYMVHGDIFKGRISDKHHVLHSLLSKIFYDMLRNKI